MKKFCKDCIYFDMHSGLYIPSILCIRDIKFIVKSDLVFGNIYTTSGEFHDPSVERVSGKCGSSGIYWKSKVT